MPSSYSFIALCSAVSPSYTRQKASQIHSLSRRELIITFGCIPLFTLTSVRTTAQSFPIDPEGMQRVLRERCSHYIALIPPVRHEALLWRGAQPKDDIVIRSPPPDLLMDETYGPEGATYFRSLDRTLRDCQTDTTVLPSRAHIATGDKRVAMNWGTPVSIWPIGPLRYAYWRDGVLLYEDGETLARSKQRGGQLVFGQGLRGALMDGKEVMFEAQAFFELSEELTSCVLTWFR